MTQAYRVAALNVNGITFATRLRMLEEFLHKHDIDITLFQEITHPDLSTLRNYNVHINQGTKVRVTAILTKAELTVTNAKPLSLDRGIASIINGTWIINIYAPSGAEKKAERKILQRPTTPPTNCNIRHVPRRRL
jgi:exonuclease III